MPEAVMGQPALCMVQLRRAYLGARHAHLVFNCAPVAGELGIERFQGLPEVW